LQEVRTNLNGATRENRGDDNTLFHVGYRRTADKTVIFPIIYFPGTINFINIKNVIECVYTAR